MNTRVVPRLAAAAVTVALLTACQGTPAEDKAGGDTVVLRLATIDKVNNNGQSYGPEAFVNGLAEVSGGRLSVEVLPDFGDGAADAESKIVQAIAAGEVDGGWPSTRAFARAGIAGLDAVEAPMTITNYAAQKELVSGPVGEAILSQLDDTGVIGLGLAVGPLRRPFAAQAPLLGPEDWQGATFRVFNSPVQSDSVTALGATPVNLGFGWIDEINTGTLRGAEFDIAQYAESGLSEEAGNVTANVVLWPKVFVLGFSRERFESLTDQQREWVQQAAREASQVSVDATYDETTPAKDLCSVGVRFLDATPAQVLALRNSLRPVIDRLAADSMNGVLLGQIQAVAAKFPRPDPLGVPDDCRQGAVQPDSATAIPDEVSTLPDGVYRVELTEEEVFAAGLDNGGGNSGTWTLTVAAGTYEIRCRPIAAPGKDCGQAVSDGPLDAGQLRGIGNQVHFVSDPELMSRLTGCKLPPSQMKADHCALVDGYAVSWVANGDSLTFTGDAYGEMVLKPWQKIA